MLPDVAQLLPKPSHTEVVVSVKIGDVRPNRWIPVTVGTPTNKRYPGLKTGKSDLLSEKLAFEAKLVTNIFLLSEPFPCLLINVGFTGALLTGGERLSTGGLEISAHSIPMLRSMR